MHQTVFFMADNQYDAKIFTACVKNTKGLIFLMVLYYII